MGRRTSVQRVRGGDGQARSRSDPSKVEGARPRAGQAGRRHRGSAPGTDGGRPQRVVRQQHVRSRAGRTSSARLETADLLRAVARFGGGRCSAQRRTRAALDRGRHRDDVRRHRCAAVRHTERRNRCVGVGRPGRAGVHGQGPDQGHVAGAVQRFHRSPLSESKMDRPPTGRVEHRSRRPRRSTDLSNPTSCHQRSPSSVAIYRAIRWERSSSWIRSCITAK